MDLTIRQSSVSRWEMTDLLGRSAGHIELALAGGFRIIPSPRAIAAMGDVSLGPYASLDVALSAIETATRGTCMIAAGDVDAVDPASEGPAV